MAATLVATCVALADQPTSAFSSLIVAFYGVEEWQGKLAVCVRWVHNAPFAMPSSHYSIAANGDRAALGSYSARCLCIIAM